MTFPRPIMLVLGQEEPWLAPAVAASAPDKDGMVTLVEAVADSKGEPTTVVHTSRCYRLDTDLLLQLNKLYQTAYDAHQIAEALFVAHANVAFEVEDRMQV